MKPQNQPPFRLIERILRRSVADNWQEAKVEWGLETVWMEPGGTCLCGHAITEHCLLRNHENGAEAVVGNCCVTNVLPGLGTGRIFAAIKRVMDDPFKSLNVEGIDYAHQRGWINDWERTFYLDTLPTCPKVRKWGLSEKQRARRKAINHKVLSQMAASRRCEDA